MIRNWREYRRLLKKQRYYELLCEIPGVNATFQFGDMFIRRDYFKNLAYWAKKDVEAFEEKNII